MSFGQSGLNTFEFKILLVQLTSLQTETTHSNRKVGLFTSANNNIATSTQVKEKAKRKKKKIVDKLPEVGIEDLEEEALS